MIRDIVLQLLYNQINPQYFTIEDFENLIFSRPHNIRLTYKGYKLLSTVVKSYHCTYTTALLSKHIMGLSYMKYPYYLSQAKFVVFSEEDALMVSLEGGVHAFLEKCDLFRKD